MFTKNISFNKKLPHKKIQLNITLNDQVNDDMIYKVINIDENINKMLNIDECETLA